MSTSTTSCTCANPCRTEESPLPQAIPFDLDGTLLDTEPDFTTILNLLLERNGRPAVDG